MRVDALIADIGSTKTLVSAFSGIRQYQPRLEGQGVSATTVREGDVCIGLERAIKDLEKKLGCSQLSWRTMMATCSAAGGLRMAAHGLVESMTSKAAREAALGAGAILVSHTHGLLSKESVEGIMNSSPRILLLSGGVDGGERKRVLHNTKILAETNGTFSVIFAGNKSIQSAVKEVFATSKVRLFVTENVYPRIDQYNITPVRNLIHNIFEEQLVESLGLGRIKQMVDGPVLPTPGAVMRASLILADCIGDLITVDVGGATTDVHSVTRGSSEFSEIQLNPEPDAKRTVEGDLGIYINAPQVQRLLSGENKPSVTEGELSRTVPMFPKTRREVLFLRSLTEVALRTALERHVGRKKRILTFRGEEDAVEGKDLTAIEWLIGTGGALTRLGGGKKILVEALRTKDSGLLLPKKRVRCLVDRHYTMAAAGLIGLKSPEVALKIMEASLGGFKHADSI